MSTFREIRQLIQSQPTADGDGVKIRRVAGFNHASFSPFLMMDELKSDDRADYVGGFPPHPHRGIETLTYMLKGHFQHRDHMDNVGELRSGGAQWMAAGRGVIHSEMPIMQEGELHGFQIWINQPAKNKMSPAQYHDFQPETITEFETQSSGVVRLIAGHLTINNERIQGPLTETGVAATVADWRAMVGHALNLTTEQDHNMMIYVYKGRVQLKDREINQGEMAILSKGEWVELQAEKESGALIFIGEPINEPVVHYGPFVMNSMEEIEQAIQDYNSGLFETY
ncbi:MULTISPECIES: pirin family protein [Vibrio]|uniref:pirin family protein n=1 Tax=Vibrio TaxID=662 RepID=UPI00106DEECB|nr:MULTISPECIES: pirin family protein [Vibrio]MCK8062013.1 pirin family protein [Vibrio sp. 1CM7H]MCS0368419.1 pirin family protein [Vibrio diabolicus]MCS0405392.1 pirin family protein [Vibrio diabolicus]QIR99671.1 pirin family protein [Vibrio diabolicus]|eukprot:TRINITY_DN11770_c0_g3_i1.p1 TRINITY_DN11770_c0_g3~~TRINITY_DN11770_c0_g3_i1.p1  ORF type:complete len:283 (+),score=37.14 TRINITY_DN11770_c0_g3_i1:399-1247(+)